MIKLAALKELSEANGSTELTRDAVELMLKFSVIVSSDREIMR